MIDVVMIRRQAKRKKQPVLPSLASFDFSVRTRKALKRGDWRRWKSYPIETTEKLIERTEEELLTCIHFGKTCLREVKDKLAAHGLFLKLASRE